MPLVSTLGTLKKYENIRDIWPDENADFSPWLEKNINLLGDKIGLSLEVVERESPVGDFTVDVLARDINSSATVVIENQLSITDHNHLGQIITYAAGKTATYVIWIVQTAREEHKAAISWLNNSTGEEIGFFLVEIQVWQVDDSHLAPAFYIAEAPNGWTKNTKRPACSFCGTSEKIKFNFWSEFNYFAFSDPNFRRNFGAITHGQATYTVSDWVHLMLTFCCTAIQEMIAWAWNCESARKRFLTTCLSQKQR